MNPDPAYPIDVLETQGRYWILDGVHRIARQYLDAVATIQLRVHPESVIPVISCEKNVTERFPTAIRDANRPPT